MSAWLLDWPTWRWAFRRLTIYGVAALGGVLIAVLYALAWRLAT